MWWRTALQHINSPGWWGTEQPALMSKLALGRGARPTGSFPELIPDTALYLSLYCDSRLTLLKQALVSLCKAIVVWNPSTVNYPQKVTFLTKPTLQIFKSTREPARRTRKKRVWPTCVSFLWAQVTPLTMTMLGINGLGYWKTKSILKSQMEAWRKRSITVTSRWRNSEASVAYGWKTKLQRK